MNQIIFCWYKLPQALWDILKIVVTALWELPIFQGRNNYSM